MNVEQISFFLIPYLGNCFDKLRKGAAIDIGVGTSAFYCSEYHASGFRTLAVEPLPAEDLKTLCLDKNISLVEGAVYSEDGFVDIYTGEFNGESLPDLSSLNQNWWGVNSKNNRIRVRSYTLQTIINQFAIDRITFMKIDTEGSEYAIVNQLLKLNQKLLPQVVEFEYGGGALKSEKKGGWEEGFFNHTLECLRVLKQLNYTNGLIIERELSAPVFFDFNQIVDLKELFQDHFAYGNIVCFKESGVNYNKILTLLKPGNITRLKQFFKKVSGK